MSYKSYLLRLCDRVLSTRDEIGCAWPYHADPKTGLWHTTHDGNWCDGHWIDMLRMTGEITGDQSLIDEALERTESVRYKLEKDDMFRGHRFYYSAARLYQATGNQEMRTLALANAYAVRSMAMSVNGAMPTGTEVQVKVADENPRNLKTRHTVCVDNVHPNLMLDWWAWKETGDEAFLRGAYRMFDVLEKHFIREDGSTIEFIDFDPDTGAIRDEYTVLGYSDDSCWSRGQAWAIAGAMFAYEHTLDPRFLRICHKVFDYWWDNCGPDLPPYDFKDPDAKTLPKDSSSSAIVTAALARLAVNDKYSEAASLIERLDPMLEALLSRTTPVDDDDKRPQGMLLDGCFNQPKLFANDHELIWGDFYLMETLYCLEKGGMPC